MDTKEASKDIISMMEKEAKFWYGIELSEGICNRLDFILQGILKKHLQSEKTVLK